PRSALARLHRHRDERERLLPGVPRDRAPVRARPGVAYLAPAAGAPGRTRDRVCHTAAGARARPRPAHSSLAPRAVSPSELAGDPTAVRPSLRRRGTA